jgi:hypothetical protein
MPGETPDRPSALGQGDSAKSVTFTIDAGTGRIDRVEVIDRNGARRELNGQERADLARQPAGPTLETMLEQAFLAGIDTLLGDGAREEEEPQSEGEKALVRGLLRPMIQRSAARRLMRREVLRQAIFRSLVEEAASPPPAASGSGQQGQPTGI